MKSYGDPSIYRNYYKAQAGYALPGYHGTPVMYGAGLGGIFRSLFRKAIPLLRRGIDIFKPHAKTAVRNIARDVAGHVTQEVLNRVNKPPPQAGSGLGYIKRRRALKRKASKVRLIGPPRPFKRKVLRGKKHQKRRAVTKRRRRTGPAKRDIF